MKKIAVIAVAAASLYATSAFAQVSVRVPGGPGITVDDGYRGYRDRDFRDSRAEYRVERRYRRDRDWDRHNWRHDWGHHGWGHGDRVYIERD